MPALPMPLHAVAVEPSGAAGPLLVRLTRRFDAAVSLRDYLTFDRRTLGLTRVLLGFLLIGDLVHRGRWWFELYSDDGIVPRASAAARSVVAFSIFNAFGTHRELAVLFALMLAVFACLLVGYKTRIAQLLALLLVTGMNSRTIIVDNSGYIAENLLVLWTCFLPLGERFSVDAILGSLRRGSADELARPSEDRRGHAHLTLLGPVVLLQLAVVYYMSSVHKTGDPWLEGKAVHYVMHCDRMIRPIVALVRDHVPNWLVHVTSYGALTAEALLPFVILSPLYRTWARRAALSLIIGLHVGFGVILALGPFSWTMCVFASLLVSAADWEVVGRAMRRTSRARTVIFDAASARAVLVCRVLRELDGLDLLTFRAGDAGPLGLAVEASDGRRPQGSAMLRDLITALPLGPIAALPLRAPLLPRVADAVLARAARLERRPLEGSPLSRDPARVQRVVARSGGRVGLLLREGLIAFFFAGAVWQVLAVHPIVKEWRKIEVPEPFVTVNRTLRLVQRWDVMAPNTPSEGIIVVDAVTIDGRHVDPLSLHAAPYTLRAPNFDLAHARGLGFDQAWVEYLPRLTASWAAPYRAPFQEYLLRLPQRTGHPEDALVSGDVYWLADENPRWNENEPYGAVQEKLFSF